MRSTISTNLGSAMEVDESKGSDEGSDERPGNYRGSRSPSGGGGRVLEPIGFTKRAYQEDDGVNVLDENLPAESEKERDEGSYPRPFRYSEGKNNLAFLSARHQRVKQLMHPIQRAKYGGLRRSLR